MCRYSLFPPGRPRRAALPSWRALVLASWFGAALVAASAYAQPSPAGEPLREQVESRFEVLPVSDGLLLRPRAEMDGIRAVEVRDGELAIDGDEASLEELERRAGAETTAAVRALLALDEEELHQLFGFDRRRSEAPRVPPVPPAPPLPPAVPDDLREEIEREMEVHRERIEREREELRERLESEMGRADEQRDRAQEQLERELERARDRWGRRNQDARVVLGSPVRIHAGEESGEVVALGGGLTVDGEVDGDAVSVGGPARIRGTVTGSVIAVGGGVWLGSDSHVHGDVVSVGGALDRSPGATVDGEVTEVSLWQGLAGGWAGGWGWNGGRWGAPYGNYFEGSLGRLLRRSIALVMLLLVGAVVATIAHGSLEGISARINAEPWKAFVVGLLTIVMFVPVSAIVAVLLAVSVVGIPLLLLWPFAVLACCFAALFGYLGAALALGRWSERRFGWRVQGSTTTTLLGLFMLHAAIPLATLIDVVDSAHDFAGFLVGMLWLFWALLQFGAWSVGVGSLLLKGRGPAAPPLATAAPALPPMPPGPIEHGSQGGPVAPAPGPTASGLAPVALATGAAVASAGQAGAGQSLAAAGSPPPPAGWEGDRWDEPFAGFGAGGTEPEAPGATESSPAASWPASDEAEEPLDADQELAADEGGSEDAEGDAGEDERAR